MSAMRLMIDTVHTSTDIPTFMSICEIQQTIQRNVQLQHLKEYIINEMAENRNEILQDRQPYLIFRDDPVAIHRLLMKRQKEKYTKRNTALKTGIIT